MFKRARRRSPNKKRSWPPTPHTSMWPRIAAVTGASGQNVIGLHFFSPAQVMKLAREWLCRRAPLTRMPWLPASRSARRLGKLGVCDSGNTRGVHRQPDPFRLSPGRRPDGGGRRFALGRSTPPSAISAFPIGIFEMQDLAGLDIGWATRKAPRPDARRGANATWRISDRLCELRLASAARQGGATTSMTAARRDAGPGGRRDHRGR